MASWGPVPVRLPAATLLRNVSACRGELAGSAQTHERGSAGEERNGSTQNSSAIECTRHKRRGGQRPDLFQWGDRGDRVAPQSRRWKQRKKSQNAAPPGDWKRVDLRSNEFATRGERLGNSP